MKASIVDGYPKGNKMKILIEDVEASQVNALRRAIIADVPKMVVSKVMFTLESTKTTIEVKFTNQSMHFLMRSLLTDWLWSLFQHNLMRVWRSQTNVRTAWILQRKTKAVQTAKSVTLNVQGPSSDSDEPYRIVRAGDLTNVSDPVFDISEEMQSIPITYLAQGQFLEFIAFATLGRGRDHAKWSAASAVTFQPLYEAELKKPKKASVLFDLDLKTSDGRAIDAKLFTNKKCSDISTVLDLEPLNQVGHGTGRDGDFDDAIVLNKIDGSFVSHTRRMVLCS